jgi:hypothetical protein
LSKWFLANIERPYLTKNKKAALAEETGLDKKQIQDWFTNNRKRKYRKVVKLALKKGKDYDYIRDVMSLKLGHPELASSDEEARSQRSAAMAAAMAKSLAGSKREASEVISEESEEAEEASLKR